MGRTKELLILVMTLAGLTAASLVGANMGASDDDSTDDSNVVDARKAIEAENWPRAIELLKKATESNPESADVQNFLGYAYRKSGNLDAALSHYKKALELNPTSAIARIEYANGLVMIEGEKKMKEAEKLYEAAAAAKPLDAMERLDVEMARAELED